jgi:gp16 family phage-associated protein
VQPPVNATTRRFWRKGYTVSGWARENGFNVNTVFQILSGTRPYKGTKGAVGQQIHAALIRDGITKGAGK